MSYSYGYESSGYRELAECENNSYENCEDDEDDLKHTNKVGEKVFNIGLDDPVVHVLRNPSGDIVKTFRKSELSGRNLDNTAMLIRIVTLEYQVKVLNDTLMDLLQSFRHLNQKQEK